MNTTLHDAFRDTCQGFSADRVVTDSELNTKFIERCRNAGLQDTAADLNIALLNLRKGGLLKGSPRSKKTSFSDEESYRYASEVAARHLEKRESTTLDRIICDPVLATEFDTIASSISPGYTSLRYRWAALNLRKARALRPELLSHVVRPRGIFLGCIDSIPIEQLPMNQGLYIFYGPNETLYVGKAMYLQRRIAKHLDHSDNKNLARWFWSNGFCNVHLEVQSLDDNTTSKVRKALEAELILSRRPIYNVQQIRREPH